MPGDTPDVHGRHGDKASDEQDGPGEEAKGAGHSIRNTAKEKIAAAVQHGRAGLGRILDACTGRSGLGDRGGHSSTHDQCQLVHGRDGDDQADASEEDWLSRPGQVREDESVKVPLLSASEVRRRIAAGNDRRKHLKKGLIKRCLGNARNVLIAACLMTSACIGATVANAGRQFRNEQPDCLEIFSGHAEVSNQFSRWGWTSMEPVDQIYGTDLHVEENRRYIVDWIRKMKPRLVIISYPCKLWSPITNIGYSTKQAQRRLHARRLREKPFLELTEEIFEHQIQQGNDALGENPLNSASFKEPEIQRILSHPEVYTGIGHGCRFGIKHLVSGKLLYKPTMWFSTSPEICDELSKRCLNETHPGHHEHGICLGDCRVTAHAGKYTKEIARAIHQGYIRTLKRKDPGKIRSMLRRISARIRREGSCQDLRWTEKNIKKALERWNTVFAVSSPDEDPHSDARASGSGSKGNGQLQGNAVERPRAGADPSGDAIMAGPKDGESDRLRPVDIPLSGLSADGITFSVPKGRKLGEPIKMALKKVHTNLGHPSKSDLKRFLKLGGVTGEILEAVEWMECITCQHAKKPCVHRTASIPPAQVVFGDEVQLDCFKIHDAKGIGYWFLSIIDRATSYHVVSILEDHTPQTFYRTFRDCWMQWAGPPNQVTVDMEGGFAGREFWEAVGRAGTPVLAIAGTAHWQAGKVERHNQIIKDVLSNVMRHGQASGLESVKEASLEACFAKNSLVREHGWSPSALVFGREPRMFGELREQGNEASYHPDVGTRDSDVAKRMRYRYHAKMEYIKSQAKHMLARSVHNRMRKMPNPQIGQQVFFWRDTPRKDKVKSSKWQGPGYIVGLQGSNAWVACGGRCYLVAGEHLREVVGDEVHYGDPSIQKAIALFKKVPEEATYEDLTGQEGPTDTKPEEDAEMDIIDEILNEEDMPDKPPPALPQEILSVTQGGVGWYQDKQGNPILVTKKTWAFRTPAPYWDANTLPYRTSWGYVSGGWVCLENMVCWTRHEQPHGMIPGGPVNMLVTVFYGRTRKDRCEGDVPWVFDKKFKLNQVMVTSLNQLKKMMDKEIPYDQISKEDWPAFEKAIEKEWQSWIDYDSCRILDVEESRKVEQECPKRVLPSRFVLRNKHAGLLGSDGQPLGLKAKARLCLAGHMCPDAMSGQLQCDSPTVERLSTMIFLHFVTSLKWTNDWFVGDISNAFLQGAPLEGEAMYMKQPKQGLPGLVKGQIIKLVKSVYGRPDAPRAWFNELSRVLQQELKFVQSVVDPAMFFLRHEDGKLGAILIVHVDDLMLCCDGSQNILKRVEELRNRFPFGTWQNVSKEPSISYCGKEIRVEGECVKLSQNKFIDGRLDEIKISKERKLQLECEVTEEERSDYRSVVGSLQWLATQTRPDIAFETNQLQKRIRDLRVGDLIRANKCVKEVKSDRIEMTFRDLGVDVEVVAFHDASLFNSVGVEINEQEADDVLLTGREKKLVYSQKGAFIGLIKKGDMDVVGNKVPMNILDWKSTTNKRVIESSLAAETHAAITAHGLARFVQALLTEVRHGPSIIQAIDDEDWQDLIPMNMITDCKSIYDHVKKDGQHLGDKGSIVQVILLRKMCSVRPTSSKARLWWVPTRDQLADALTKSKGKCLRETLGWAQFHERSAAQMRGSLIKENRTSVNFHEKA